MYPEERQQAIASLVMSRGRASVAELAEVYAVTTETVRRYYPKWYRGPADVNAANKELS